MIWLDSKRLLLFGGFSGEKSTVPESTAFIFHIDNATWAPASAATVAGVFELSRAGNAVTALSAHSAVSIGGISPQGQFCSDIVSISF